MTTKPAKVKHNKKDAQLLIRISTAEREQFLQLCEQLDTSAAREIRHFIREFVLKNTPAESPKTKETENVEENQNRRKEKRDLAEGADRKAQSQDRKAREKDQSSEESR